MKKNKVKNVRLPKSIIPIHYDLFFEPDLDNFTFQGEETITVDVKKSTDTVVLHSAEIEVLSASFKSRKEIELLDIKYNDREETVTLKFAAKLPFGHGSLHIKFAGILNDKMRGFYRSRYQHAGNTFHMGVTQFESTDARRAFPCFDEPAHKATFDVALKVPNDRTVISNTIETEIMEHAGGYKTVKFATSPKMSSYLLAFIIGHFEYIKTTTKEGVMVRVFVTPGKKKQAKFALDVAAKIISFYSDYFGVPYPLQTMDLIAIPDFANGAMENWGAVTYRETALLVDEDNSSLHTKQWVALVIAHELAHQWFGNLVTMEWWTHLWLNEGFASFMEYVAIDKLFPEWHVWTQFVYTEQAKALALDGLENTHAIEIPVYHPAEISEIFDIVSYSKGASIIRMLVAYLGEDKFRKGLSQYLKTHSFANASTSDLWNALEKSSGVPVAAIMKNWTSKPGYPLVTVSWNNGLIKFEQERFFASPLVKNKSIQKWLIPMTLISDKTRRPKKFLIDKKSVTISGFGKSRWVKANYGDTSFTRIRYDEKSLAELEKLIIGPDKLTEEGKFALIRDIFALAASNKVSSNKAFEFTSYFRNERSYIIWAEIITHLMEYKNLLYGQDVYEDYLNYCRLLLLQIAEYVSWKKKKNESHSEGLLRAAVIFALGTLGDESTIIKARNIFKTSLKGGRIDSDIRGGVYAIVAQNGGRREFEHFMKLYLEAESEEEKDRALRALCSFQDKAFLEKILKLSFSNKVRAQDSMKAIIFLCGNPSGINLAFDYMKKNWEILEDKFGGGHLLARFISPFAKLRTKSEADDLEVFFAKKKIVGIERTVAQTLEQIRSNEALLKRDLSKIRKYFKSS